MKICSLFPASLAALLLAGCAGAPSEKVVHERAWAPAKSAPPRAIVICLDGTANTPGDRTNVRRVFDVISISHRPEVLSYYDPGVGTGWFGRFNGLAFGSGHALNVREAATFLATHYRPGDKVYILGFSRGAFEALDLCGFLRECGLPDPVAERPRFGADLETKEGVSAWSKATTPREAEARRLVGDLWSIYNNGEAAGYGLRKPMDENSAKRLDTFWAAHRGAKPRQLAGRGFPIEALALWDPVDSVGKIALTAVESPHHLENRVVAGHLHHNLALGPEIKKARFALALDEHRSAFTPALPPSPAIVQRLRAQGIAAASPNVLPSGDGKSPAVKFVWFTGDHSDVGGGHAASKDLAGLTLNWMLDECAQDDIPRRVFASVDGPSHDLYATSFWGCARSRVRREMFTDPAMHGINAEGWPMKIHESVFLRHASSKVLDAKGQHYLPRPFRPNAFANRPAGEAADISTSVFERFPREPLTRAAFGSPFAER